MREAPPHDTEAMLRENAARRARLLAPVNPITGEGEPLERHTLVLPDYDIEVQHVPLAAANTPLFQELERHGSIGRFVQDYLRPQSGEEARLFTEQTRDLIERVRMGHDFPFWAAAYAYIQNKQPGPDVTLSPNHPQRKLVAALEGMRLRGEPIRLVILKARQWGGSTLVQMYMAWLQLTQRRGLNSIIVAQVGDIAAGIKAKYQRMLERYPTRLLHPPGEAFKADEVKFHSVMGSHSMHTIPQRGCYVKIGSAESPNSVRGENYALVHGSEVGLWKGKDGTTDEEIAKAVTSGVLLEPMTMIVYESTAKGVANFFHSEWCAAVAGTSQFKPFFVSWHEIEQYSLPLKDPREFADRLLRERNSREARNSREDSGEYRWWLWEQGATLEGVNWYVEERRKCSSHEFMASEYPTDPEEAFTHSGRQVFSLSGVERLRPTCRPAGLTGELYGERQDGEQALRSIRFTPDETGALEVWEEPEQDDPQEPIADRYLVVADVGRGLSDKADYSVIAVLDRLMMMDDPEGRPQIVAQWRGRTDMDLLAWKAAQIASWYNNALLVVESNTLETTGGISRQIRDSTPFVLSMIAEAYPNLYARQQSAEDIRQGLPRKYGFHTNAKTKGEVVDFLVWAVRESRYIERDERMLSELLTYETTDRGGYAAPPGCHDDILMTRAIGLYVCYRQQPRPRIARPGDILATITHSLSEASI
ncbi:MAG: terminase [Prevotellaceae bacterium]|nr:terminase [Prevotellaceae bacterium]